MELMSLFLIWENRCWGIVPNVFWHIFSLYYKWLFRIRLLDSLYFSVYENIFKKVSSMIFEKCPRSVNNFRTKYLWGTFCDSGGLKWSPSPTPIPSVNVKVPFWGKI